MNGRPVRILVAGGAGFVGSAIVRNLLDRNLQVGVIDSYLHGDHANLADVKDGLAFHVTADVCAPHAASSAFRQFRPTHVISTIGDTFVQDAYSEPDRFIANNVEATLRVLEAARDTGVAHVVYASSTEVYGDQRGDALSETAPLDPKNTYAVTKLAADRLCHTFALEHGVRVTVARLFNTYGPRATHAYIVPEIIHQLSRGEELTLGNIDAIRDFTYVEDTAQALVTLLFRGRLNHDVYNIGSGPESSRSVRDLALLIAKIMGVNAMSIVIDADRLRRRDLDRFVCNSTRLSSETGWSPQISLGQGLVKTVQWFRDNGSVWPWNQEPGLAPLSGLAGQRLG